MKIFLSLFLFILVPSTAVAAEYKIDPVHTKIIFKIKHLGISTVTGQFAQFEGTFSFDDKNIAAATVQAKITTKSIDTDHEKRDNHLRSPDFFNATEYPAISFQSKEIKDIKGNSFKIVGDLSIHGVTKSVTLDAEFGGAVKDPWGKERAALAQVHRENGIVGLIQESPELLSTGTLFCADGDRDYRSPRMALYTELLIDLEFNQRVPIYNANTLPTQAFSAGQQLAVENNCHGKLVERGVRFRNQKSGNNSAVIEVL